ncbi:hypothetical protein B0H11DRAFT_1914904 [Mycena galericulata]|nr:hypothetical protein B0H11DRAFT_1914904 [Mycena galericulata]
MAVDALEELLILTGPMGTSLEIPKSCLLDRSGSRANSDNDGFAHEFTNCIHVHSVSLLPFRLVVSTPHPAPVTSPVRSRANLFGARGPASHVAGAAPSAKLPTLRDQGQLIANYTFSTLLGLPLISLPPRLSRISFSFRRHAGSRVTRPGTLRRGLHARSRLAQPDLVSGPARVQMRPGGADSAGLEVAPPVQTRKCTPAPVTVNVTAGVRLLRGSQAAAVSAHLRSPYPRGGGRRRRGDGRGRPHTFPAVRARRLCFEPARARGEYKYELGLWFEEDPRIRIWYIWYGLRDAACACAADAARGVSKARLARRGARGERRAGAQAVVMDGGGGGDGARARAREGRGVRGAFGGVYQPALSEAFPARTGLLIRPLVPEPGEDAPLTATADTHDRRVGAGDTDSTIPREVMFGKRIAGTELGWYHGAGIDLVGGVDVQCWMLLGGVDVRLGYNFLRM